MATIIEGDPKVHFSIAATPRCRGGYYYFPWIVPLYPWSLPYNAECWEKRYQVPFFKSLVWLDLALNPGLLGYWWTLYPRDHWTDYKYMYISICMYMCRKVCIYICQIPIYMYVYAYMYIGICVSVCVYIYIYMDWLSFMVYQSLLVI